jgi:hypothetical protein
MLWTLILSFTIGGGYVGSGTYNASTSSVVVPNLPSKEICEKTGAEHVKKFKSNQYAYYVGVYTCVEQGK